jgi:hypothetical protein
VPQQELEPAIFMCRSSKISPTCFGTDYRRQIQISKAYYLEPKSLLRKIEVFLFCILDVSHLRSWILYCSYGMLSALQVSNKILNMHEYRARLHECTDRNGRREIA